MSERKHDGRYSNDTLRVFRFDDSAIRNGANSVKLQLVELFINFLRRDLTKKRIAVPPRTSARSNLAETRRDSKCNLLVKQSPSSRELRSVERVYVRDSLELRSKYLSCLFLTSFGDARARARLRHPLYIEQL
jgi:hypothetical protein